LAGSTASYLASCGCRLALIGRSASKLSDLTRKIRSQVGEAECLELVADVLDRPALEEARKKVLDKWGSVDGLLNAAGGNIPGATVLPEQSVFDLDLEAFRQVIDLNLHGTVLPTLVFGETMVAGRTGSIINFSSVSATRVLTRVVGYSAAKSGVENFTRWMAVDLARRSGGGVRVNAIMPGFFLGEQNRALLTNPDGSLTARGETVVAHTPFGRFGNPDELHGTIHHLLADSSRFVTGTVLPVDGGFTAFSGI
jgi:NAD(P)-dependent dehydrogenase (short-subunit alcohol dehydrogenase family)